MSAHPYCCECDDPTCKSRHAKCQSKAHTILTRKDYADHLGMAVCNKCKQHWLDTGLFKENITMKIKMTRRTPCPTDRVLGKGKYAPQIMPNVVP